MSVRSRSRVSRKTAGAYKNSPSTLIGTITRRGPRVRNVIAAAQSGRFAVRCVLMEEGPDPKGKKADQPFSWLPQIDQVLVVGMKYGPKGTHEAVKKLRQIVPELSPAQIWHRMRHLREKDRGKRTGPIDWSEEAIETLRDGYRSGGRKKATAIKTVRALYPGLSGYAVSRFARSQGWLEGERRTKKNDGRRPWTREEEQELFVRAGYDSVKEIARKLRRSEQSVRFRLKGRSISARVTDGWSLRRLQQTLHVSYRRLQHLIGNGFLKVRDPRVSLISLAEWYEKHRTTLQPGVEDKIAADLWKEKNGHSWGRVAKLLGVTAAEVGKMGRKRRAQVSRPFRDRPSF